MIFNITYAVHTTSVKVRKIDIGLVYDKPVDRPFFMYDNGTYYIVCNELHKWFMDFNIDYTFYYVSSILDDNFGWNIQILNKDQAVLFKLVWM